jgi:hypothetical protein
MTNKLVFILVEDSDQEDVAYINGEHTVGHYYFSLEAVEWTAKKLDPNIEIEYWEITREVTQELNGLPIQLPDDFIEAWSPVQKFLDA